MSLEVQISTDLPIIETHQHISERGKGDRTFGWSGNNIENIVGAMSAAHVVAAILQPLGGAEDPIAVHREIAENMAAYPGHIFGIASLNIKEYGEDKTVRELEYCVKELGFVGIKLHGFSHGFAPNSPLGRVYFETADRLGVPLMGCVGAHGMPFTNPGLYADMALEFPDLKVVFAHLDYPVAEEAVSIARRQPNIYLSSSLSIPAYLRLALENCGPHKLLLASEDSGSIAAEIAKFAALGATDNELEQMLCTTPAEVFALKGRVASAPPNAPAVSMARQAGFVGTA
ncbi:MAG: amidohydrolase family protein [Armatimonadetes bacterium]|nr:amidohydrolase family protein [Armatimonadota bacterium]MDE2206916.1 amidohydrolase family protein [Armatimonadota bacterium]